MKDIKRLTFVRGQLFGKFRIGDGQIVFECGHVFLKIGFVRRIEADAEAYATGVVAKAIAENGIEAAQYQVALKQVEALNALGNGDGKQTIVLPANALEAFGDAFKMLKGGK